MNSLPVEVFAIGTELVIGRILDTNSQWLAGQLAELGASVRRITLLTDDLDEIVSALRDAIDRGSRLILTTGGLGPTPDDLTVEAMARVLGRGTFVDEPTLDDYVRRRNLSSRSDVSAGLIKMATVPEGSEVCPNPAGWAPCTFVPHDGGLIVIMPGPPKEMEAVFTMHVAERVAQLSPHKTAALRVVVSMFESEVSPLLQEVMARFPGTYLKGYVAMRDPGGQNLPVDVVSTGEDDAAARHKLQEAIAFLGELVTAKGKVMEYGED